MDWVVIDGVKPYDGRYELDITDRELTTREWGWIKKYSGYMPLTIGDGLAGGDPELFSVFAVIALRRADRIQAGDVADMYERLLDSGFGSTIILEADTADMEDADPGPPPSSSNGNEPLSGGSSPTSSETSADNPKPTGTLGSATSESVPVTLVS